MLVPSCLEGYRHVSVNDSLKQLASCDSKHLNINFLHIEIEFVASLNFVMTPFDVITYTKYTMKCSALVYMK